MGLLPVELPSHTPCPTSQGNHRAVAEIPVLYNFSLTICFTHGNVYMPILPSQFFPPSPSPAVSTSPFSMCACPENRFISTIFSRFYMYSLIYDICFSLTSFTVYNRCRFIHLVQLTQTCSFFLWLCNIHCIRVPRLLYPFIC